MAWIRDGAPPEKIKVSFVVSAKEHRELSQFILSLPYRQTSSILREILSSAVKNAGASGLAEDLLPVREGAGHNPTPMEPREQAGMPLRTPGVTPGTEDVSAAAAGIIENFDRMFPS